MLRINDRGLWFEGNDWTFGSYNRDIENDSDFGGFYIGFAVHGRGHYSFGWDEEFGWDFTHISQEKIDELLAAIDKIESQQEIWLDLEDFNKWLDDHAEPGVP